MPIRFLDIISISNFLSNDLAIRIKTIGIENNLAYGLVFFRRKVQIFLLPRGVSMHTLYKMLPQDEGLSSFGIKSKKEEFIPPP